MTSKSISEIKLEEEMKFDKNKALYNYNMNENDYVKPVTFQYHGQ